MKCVVRSWRSCCIWGNISTSSGNSVLCATWLTHQRFKCPSMNTKGGAQRMAFIRLEETFRLGHGLDSKRRQRSVLKDGWEFTRWMSRFQAGEENQTDVLGRYKWGCRCSPRSERTLKANSRPTSWLQEKPTVSLSWRFREGVWHPRPRTAG